MGKRIIGLLSLIFLFILIFNQVATAASKKPKHAPILYIGSVSKNYIKLYISQRQIQGIKKVKIYRSNKENGSFKKIREIKPSIDEEYYTDKGLLASTTYWYRVCYSNLLGNGPFSNTLKVTTNNSDNKVLWDGVPVDINVIGRIKTYNNSEKIYIRDSENSYVQSGYFINPKTIKIVYSKIKKDSDYYYKIGENEYLKASLNIKYEKIPSSIIHFVEENTFNETVDSVVKGANTKKTTLEKVLYVHNFLLDHVTYDNVNIHSHDEIGAIVYGRAACQGYSEALDFLLKKLKIESKVVVSYQMNHAWNMIKIDNQWYHIDVTWDDTSTEYSYTYFLISDKTIKENSHHGWGKEYPIANSERFSYFQQLSNSNLIDTDYEYFYYSDWLGNEIKKMSLDGEINSIFTSYKEGYKMQSIHYLNNYLYILIKDESSCEKIGEDYFFTYIIYRLSLDNIEQTEIKSFTSRYYNPIIEFSDFDFYKKDDSIILELNGEKLKIE